MTPTFAGLSTIVGVGTRLRTKAWPRTRKRSGWTPTSRWPGRDWAGPISDDFEVSETLKSRTAREWPSIGPKLKGKIHVYAGEKDMFLLDGAAILLKESLAKLGSDAEVTIVPGMNHTMHRAGIQAMMERVRGVKLQSEDAGKK